MDEQIANLMKKLDLTEDEARQLIADDKAIDRGEKLFEQTADQKQASKKYRQGETARVYSYTQRERKADNDKRTLVDLLATALENVATGGVVDIANPERQIDFEYNGKRYRVVLSAPRK